MKEFKRIILAFGLAVGVALVCSAAGLADSGEKAAKDNGLVGATGSYGATKTVIKWADPPMFSHNYHLNEAELDCDSCHPDTFQKKRGSAKAAGDFTMKALEEGKYCGICHDGDTAFGVKEPETCVTCHGSSMKQPKTIIFEKPVKAVVFDHSMHTDDLGLECGDCHSDVFKMKLGNAEKNPEAFTMEALYAGKYCGACHDGDTAFASDTQCASCHIGVIGFNRLFKKKLHKTPGHGAEH